MTLVDTGPLVSLVDKANADLHRKCLLAAGTLSGALLTTWPCLTEAMYLLGQVQGWSSQNGLWQMVEHGAVVLHIPNDGELSRVRDLMRQYQRHSYGLCRWVAGRACRNNRPQKNLHA